ncbi:MAG TPA: hypothetical protein VGG08_03345 [Solirubrobacteraceae bacterium]
MKQQTEQTEQTEQMEPDGLDWDRWNSAYEDAASPLSRRLRLVQRQIAEALGRSPHGPLRAISVCAGQGQDLIGVLTRHPRRDDVSARLVELDEASVAHARASAATAGLERVEVLAGDASLGDAYVGAVPADLVLLCGVLGNISESDVENVVAHLPELCAPGATVVWTRHRNPPDLTPRIRAWFTAAGFEELTFQDAPPYAVGAHRFAGDPRPLPARLRLFEFIGHRALWPHLEPERREALLALFRPDCSRVELVEAVRALPYGLPEPATAEGMLREARGTSRLKHMFLAPILARRFPETSPRIVHRVYRLGRERARALFGPQVAEAVPAEGVVDLHRYLRVVVEERQIELDVSLGGAPWDGRGALAPVCGDGEDFEPTSDEDPDAHLRQLEAERCDAAARAPLLAALAMAGRPPA